MAFPGSVTADSETPDVPGTGDISDDPAILLHPTTPTSSVIITTSKDFTNGGLYAYNLSNTQTDTEDTGTAFNNVDLRYNLGQYDNVIGASNRENGKIEFYTYDFSNTGDEMSSVGSISTGYGEPYGFAMGRLATSTGEKFYAFVSGNNGSNVKQYELTESGGVVSGTLVRTITAPNGSQVEGIVVDDENGYVYIGEEDHGIYRYGTDPASGSTHTTVDTDGVGGHLVEDVEGLAIYYGAGGEGYLIASSQGESTYAVYEREGSNTYLGEFSMSGNSGGTVDGTFETDGLDVTNVNLGGDYTEGLFIAHDGNNTGTGADSSNFKLVGFDEIASLGGLTVDTTTYDPRAEVTTAPLPPPFFSINTTDPSTITYTGTSGADTLTGTSAAEKFDGLGGADTYSGGLGDDHYLVGDTGDTITDPGGQDQVELSGTFNYTIPNNLEHIIVLGSTPRTITGNADENIMTTQGSGTAGAITFNAGTGDDNIRVFSRDVVATGGADNDIFRYSTSATGTGNTITDFTWGEDLINASELVANSYAPTIDPFTNGVLRLDDSGSDVKLMWDQDGSSNSTIAAVEVVTVLGVQIDAGINNAHIYTGL